MNRIDAKTARTRTLNRDAQGSFHWQPYLGAGENLLWQGQREGPMRFPVNLIPQTLVLLIWTGFAIFITLKSANANPIPAIMGLAFTIIGITQLYRIYRRSGAAFQAPHYALTNERILVFKNNSLHAIPITPHLQMRVEHHASLDSIYFENAREVQDDDQFGWDIDFRSARRQSALGFEGISDGQKIYHKILEIQKGRHE